MAAQGKLHWIVALVCLAGAAPVRCAAQATLAGHVVDDNGAPVRDAIVTVRGRIDGCDDTPKLMAVDITRPEVHADAGRPVRLRIKAGALTDDRVQRLRAILSANPGVNPVLLTLIGPDKETDLRLGDEFRCDARNGLFAELRILFGADCIG